MSNYFTAEVDFPNKTSVVMAGVTDNGNGQVISADQMLETWVEAGVETGKYISIAPMPSPAVPVSYDDLDSLIAWLWAAPGVSDVRVKDRPAVSVGAGCCDPEAFVSE